MSACLEYVFSCCGTCWETAAAREKRARENGAADFRTLQVGLIVGGAAGLVTGGLATGSAALGGKMSAIACGTASKITNVFKDQVIDKLADKYRKKNE